MTTFLENCGVGDLVVASIAGRNRKVAEAFVTAGKVRIVYVATKIYRLINYYWLRDYMLEFERQPKLINFASIQCHRAS